MSAKATCESCVTRVSGTWHQQSLAQVPLTPIPEVRGEQCWSVSPHPGQVFPGRAGHSMQGTHQTGSGGSWCSAGATLVCCSRGKPSPNLPFKAWLCEGGSRKNRTLPHGSFSLQYHVYSETFIAAQQSKNMLHENCTGKSRALEELGECADKNQNGIASFKICHGKQTTE